MQPTRSPASFSPPPAAPHGARRRVTLLLAATALVLGGCATHRPGTLTPTVLPPLPPLAANAGIASPRVSGAVDARETFPQVSESSGRGVVVSTIGGAGSEGGGNVTLDFADTDIREVAAQILGNTLHANYTIDPAVHGTATLRTVVPLTAHQLIPVLQSLLAQNGATLVRSGGVYRVLPAAAAAGAAGAEGTAGGMMVPLRYAAADDLAKVLQPYAQGGARVLAIPSSNALVIAGEPAQRDSLVELVRAFDIDVLEGQSYALFPVDSGSASDMADAMKQAFRTGQGGTLNAQLRVIPMARVNAVLVVANNPRYITDARRAFSLIERGRRETKRTWHVYYLQNGTANDVAYVLQQAFTPNNVTAQPSARATGQAGGTSAASGGGISGLGGSSSSGSGSTGGGLGSSGSSGGSSTGSGSSGGLGSAFGHSGGSGAPTTPSASSTGSNPLLGGISNSGGGGGGDNPENMMRIIPNPDNNAVLIFGTGQEEDTVEAMLRKIDIMPLQVRIDALIAEVTLNDNLSYGTQFFFRKHATTVGLTNGSGSATGPLGTVVPLAANSSPLGFVLNEVGTNDGAAVLEALQKVTTIKVLSSPQLLVLDNETAQLEVGDLVPVQTGSITTVSTATPSTAESIDYRQTGVITAITPRVNSSGLVTLDIQQEVSEVNQNAAATGINSPTFTERAVKSRVVIEDGQTIGLAGLILDNVQTGNSGVPWLKDVPLLGTAFGSQNNTRQRTELLILLTPHVLHDQRDARSLTEDMRQELPRAAALPYEAQTLKQQGRDDPQLGVRKALGLSPN